MTEETAGDSPAVPPLGGRYHVGRFVGRGGEGAVFEVRTADEANPNAGLIPEGRRIAKVTSVFAGRGELAKLQRLRHPRICSYLDVGAFEGREWAELGVAGLWQRFGLRRGPAEGQHLVWIIMERALGSLGHRIDEQPGGAARSPLAAAEAMKLWEHLTEALDYLQQQKVVHGDIKPDNVLGFGIPGDEDWRLTDFGIAVDVESGRSRATMVGQTPLYASPQAASTGHVSFADDRYSAALTVHVAATGHFPEFGPDGPHLDPTLPEALREALGAALRYETNSSLGTDTLVATDPDAKTMTMPGPQLLVTPSRRRSRAWRVVAAGIATAVLVVAVFARFRADTSDSDGTSRAGATTTSLASVTPRSGTTPASLSTDLEQPVVTGSPSGTNSGVLFTRRAGGSTQVVRIGLSSGTQSIVEIALDDPREPTASDTDSIAVVTGTAPEALLAVGSSGEPNYRTFDLGRGVSDPAFSPDGTEVAFASSAAGSDDVLILELASGQVRTLAGGSADETEPAWSPDGTEVALLRSGSTGDALITVEVDSGEETTIAPAEGAKASPAWSPDGTSLAFIGTSNGGRDVFTVSANGGTPRILRLTASDEGSVAWCSAGIVTSAVRRGLSLIDDKGAAERVLTTSGADSDPDCGFAS